MRKNCLLLLALLPGLTRAADVCNPANLLGPYAVQLTGSTTIAGSPKPTASLARIEFDGRGGISGTASASFRGLLLGNPVTGSYEAAPDCSVTWKLQDDSGAFQNFSGTMSPDGTGARFQQTDPGGAQNGILQKMPAQCTAADLMKKYTFELNGITTPMQPGDVSRKVSEKGGVDVARNGSFKVEADCSVRFRLAPESEDGADLALIHMRGFLVNGGKDILAFQTDPGAMVAARLHRRQ